MGRPKAIFDILLKLWPLNKTANWLGNQPIIGGLISPVFNSSDYESIILPIHEVVKEDESTVLPYQLLKPIVRKADARVTLNHCICRHAEKCQTFPDTLGCLFLGEGAAKIHPSLGKPISTESALDHMRKAMALGLVPLVVHASFDAFVLGIPYRKMLAICFCCECCCTIRHGMRLGPRAFWDTVVRLPGLQVEVTDDCAGCGECEEVCHVRAIKVEYGKARISENCKGCGRCIDACRVGAIHLQLDENRDVLKELIHRIENRTDIGQLNGKPR